MLWEMKFLELVKRFIKDSFLGQMFLIMAAPLK